MYSGFGQEDSWRGEPESKFTTFSGQLFLLMKTSNWNYCSNFAYLDHFPIICLGLFFFFWTETKSTNGCRSSETASLREASVLLHGDDPVCHQQPEEQADDAERDLQLDRGPLPVLQTGGQTGLEGTHELYEGKHYKAGHSFVFDFYLFSLFSITTEFHPP